MLFSSVNWLFGFNSFGVVFFFAFWCLAASMERNFRRMNSLNGGISDIALERVMSYIDDPWTRNAMSLVCKKWYHIDSMTRRHITIALSYSTSPDRLTRRFPNLESIFMKGKPRAAMFNLIPEDWGGYAGPWIREIAAASSNIGLHEPGSARDAFECLKSIHFRRMIIMDNDIDILVRARGHMLIALKMDNCSGFSTDGLRYIAQSCRSLRTLNVEESIITENDGLWVHELAVRNDVLETLNFHRTELRDISYEDLELLARNCNNLISLQISDVDVSDLVGFFRSATSLEEFSGGSFSDKVVEAAGYYNVRFPPTLCRLGLNYMTRNEMHVIFPYGAVLKKLDLQWACLSTEDHCQLIQQCPNLEDLEVRNVIGDRGLEVLANTCRRLKRLRIERGEDERGLEDEQGLVSQRGLSRIAQGCPELRYLAVYVFDINNAALEDIGRYSQNLDDFRMVLLERKEQIEDFPLDNGVRSLLSGCTKLVRFSLYLRQGGLTDVGMGYIGRYSTNIRYMLLGFLGQSDQGLLSFSRGCLSLQKLEMRGFRFSERAFAEAVMQLRSLRYIWVQGYNSSEDGRHLLAMVRPYWNIEFIPTARIIEEDGRIVEHPAQFLAYYSLAGRRNDCPESVIPLFPAD